MTRRILIAYDESPQASAALQHALTHYADAEVTILHVNDPQEWVFGDGMGGGYYSEEAYERVQESATEVLEEAEATADEHGVEATTATETGNPATAVVEYAEANDIDHIVMGSHGRKGLSRFLLGSVAETVTRRSPVSVTIIRETEPETTE